MLNQNNLVATMSDNSKSMLRILFSSGDTRNDHKNKARGHYFRSSNGIVFLSDDSTPHVCQRNEVYVARPKP